MRKHKASLGEHGEGTVGRRLWGCCPDKQPTACRLLGYKLRNCATSSM